MSQEPHPRALPPEVRELLVCPQCRGELSDEDEGLLCASEQLWYPVVDGVPYLIPEKAEQR